MIHRNMFYPLAFCAMAVLVSSTVMAASINVDFGSTDGTSGVYSGTAVAPDTGTIWNGITPEANVTPFTMYTSGALVDSAGNATGITTTINNSWVYDGAADSVIAPALMHDYLFTQSPGATFTFSIDGLTDGGLYDLYLYSDTGAQVTDYDIGGEVKIVTNTDEQSVWTQGANYEVYSGLVATGGTISVSATGHDQPVWDNYAVLNGFQLVAVPEPSAIILVATGLLGLLACARQKWI